MSTETTVNPDAIEQASEPIPLHRPSSNGTEGDDGRRLYDVNARGEVENVRAPEESQGEISTTEATFKNGTGQVGDPVLIDGRRGMVVQFLFVPARTAKKNGRAAGWDVVVAFEEGEPKERKLNPADVDLLLDEIKRPSKPLGEPGVYPVPSDVSFGGKETKEAADLRQLGREWIDGTEDFPHLRGRDLDFEWAAKGGSTSYEPKIAWVRGLNVHERRKSNAQFMVVVAADHLRDLRADREVVAAIVHDALCLLRRSKKGKLYIGKPDFSGNTKNVERCGAILPKAKRAAMALARARSFEDGRNVPLFGDDDAQTAKADDGAGVLIHEDGTPLSEEEIAELEAGEEGDFGV